MGSWFHLVCGIGFQQTISVGWILATVTIMAFGGYFAWRDRSVGRWRGLYDLADSERKEIQQQRDECLEALQEAKVTIERLDALQMPIKIVELMNESVHRIDTGAKERLDSSLAILRHDTEERERRDQERHVELMGLMHELKGALSRVGRINGQ